MTRSYTTKAKIERIIHPLCELLADVSAYYRFPYSTHFLLTESGLKTGAGQLQPNGGGLSNHKILRIQAKYNETSNEEISQLKQLIAHIPPLRKERKVEVRVQFGQSITAAIGIDGFLLKSHSKVAEQNLTSQLYDFIRTHDNFDMGCDLYPFVIAPNSQVYKGAIWADTAENAILRFAAIYPQLRSEIRRGKAFSCARLADPPSAHVVAALSRKLHKSPALTDRPRTLHHIDVSEV